MRKRWVLYGIFIWGLPIGLMAQGCSDAGVCTMAPHSTNSTDSTTWRHSFRLAAVYGMGERFVANTVLQPELSLGLWAGGSLTGRVPLLINVGTLGVTVGIGDPICVISQRIRLSPSTYLSLNAGARVPTGHANRDSLPMPYQTSLGTWDVLVGAEIQHRQWRFRGGYQHVLHNQNRNEYLPPGNPSDGRGESYFASRQLVRGNDAVGRIDRSFRFPKWVLTASVLMVWRLQADTYLNVDNRRVAMPESTGPTVNIVLTARIPLSRQWALEPQIAAPLLARHQRPDGLTRTVLAGISIGYVFGRY